MKQKLFDSLFDAFDLTATQGQMDDFLNALNVNGIGLVPKEKEKEKSKCKGNLDVCKEEFLINNPNPKMDFDDHRICIICNETYPAF